MKDKTEFRSKVTKEWLIIWEVWTQIQQIDLMSVCKPPPTEKWSEVRS